VYPRGPSEASTAGKACRELAQGPSLAARIASFQQTGSVTLQKRAERGGRAVCVRVGNRRGGHGEQHAVHAEGGLQLRGHGRLARGVAAQELRRAVALRPGPC